MDKVQITIFTPTYNRGYTLENLYHSLKMQTCKEFEWLVIDDASEDDTQQKVDEWVQNEKFFPIRYIRKQNGGGKHRAINDAVKLAKGKLFFIVDSDDMLTEDAIEKILLWEKKIQNKAGFAGVSGNKGKNKEEIVGKTFSGEYIDAAFTQRDALNILGDKAEVYYTNILAQYPFPEFEGERFITERVVWDKIGADGYKIRWYNEVIYLCEYLPDGLTQNGDEVFRKNPKGAAFNLNQMMKIYHYSFFQKLRSVNGYIEFYLPVISAAQICEYLEISQLYYWLCRFTAQVYRVMKYRR